MKAAIGSFVILFMSELICLSSSYQRFIHISDLHLDIGYTPGSRAENMCHNSSSILSEAEGGASKYGNFRCDSPKKLVLSAIRYLQKIEPNPDFILWTGDSSPHWNDAEHNLEEVYSNLRLVTRELHKRFPNVMIIPALGNHDSHPTDFFADPAIDSALAKRIYSGYIVQGSLGDLLGEYPEALSKFKECGYYSIKKKNYFKENITQTFIVLNTNLYYNNKAKTNETDPCGQFKWLETELRNAKDNERIFIVAHVPPGFFELRPVTPFFDTDNHTRMLTQILSEKKAAKKIVGHFYGHMHTDAIRLFLDTDDEVRGIGFAAPSVTPFMYEGGVNPSVRIYDYNPENRTIVDYETHYLPLDQLIVNNTSDACPEVVTQPSEVTEADDDESTSGGAKSRRKNSKFLEREQRQAPTTRSTSTMSTSTTSTTAATTKNPTLLTTVDNEDETFEKLATEQSSTKLPEVVTIHPDEEAENTTPVERDETTLKSSTLKSSTPTAIIQSTKVVVDNQTSTDNSTTPLTNADPDIDCLVRHWTRGYKKQSSLGVDDLSPKSVYNAYLTMKQDRENSKFKSYHRQTWVLHDPSAYIDCNDTCHTIFMCAMVHFTSDDFFDCIHESGHALARPSTTDATTTSTASTTSFVDYQRTTSSYSRLRTSSDPTSLTTSRSYNSFVHDDPKIGIEPSDSEKQGESGVIRGIAIGFAGIALIAIAGFSFAFYRKTRINRYRSQEFLLTDSVFRYDGYSQVEQP